MITSSQLACAGLGLPPIGIPSESAFHCAKCAGHFQAGASQIGLRLGSTFVDSIALAGREDPRWSCGWCEALGKKYVMGSTSKSFITENEAFPIFKGENRVWILQNLPPPPFVAVCTDAKAAHMLWRTPITRSHDLIYLRLGARLLMIRMHLVRAIDAELKQFKAPFACYDWDLKDITSGRLRRGVSTPELDRIYPYAGPGEWWALLALNSIALPERPEPIRLDLAKSGAATSAKTKKIKEPKGQPTQPIAS